MEEWVKKPSSSKPGYHYYYNPRTKESVWEMPKGYVAKRKHGEGEVESKRAKHDDNVCVVKPVVKKQVKKSPEKLTPRKHLPGMGAASKHLSNACHSVALKGDAGHSVAHTAVASKRFSDISHTQSCAGLATVRQSVKHGSLFEKVLGKPQGGASLPAGASLLLADTDLAVPVVSGMSCPTAAGDSCYPTTKLYQNLGESQLKIHRNSVISRGNSLYAHNCPAQPDATHTSIHEHPCATTVPKPQPSRYSHLTQSFSGHYSHVSSSQTKPSLSTSAISSASRQPASSWLTSDSSSASQQPAFAWSTSTPFSRQMSQTSAGSEVTLVDQGYSVPSTPAVSFSSAVGQLPHTAGQLSATVQVAATRLFAAADRQPVATTEPASDAAIAAENHLTLVDFQQGRIDTVKLLMSRMQPGDAETPALDTPIVDTPSAAREDMEVDPTISDILHLRTEKVRLFKHAGSDTLALLLQNSGPEAMQVDYTSNDERGLFMVLDTNVLLQHLKFVKEVKDEWYTGFSRPTLVIPWVVIQELDALKDANTRLGLSTGLKAREAIKHIHQLLENRHPRLECQRPEDSRLGDGGANNDDRILQCAVQWRGRHTDAEVILLTQDRNLQNKAYIQQLKVFSKESFVDWITKLPKKDDVRSSMSDSGSSISGRMNMDATSDTMPGGRQHHPSLDKRLVALQERRIVDDVLCIMKNIIRNRLSLFIKEAMRKTYSDLWEQIVLQKPPWDYYDIFINLNKHWIAVFSHILQKKQAKTLIEEILRVNKSRNFEGGMSMQDTATLMDDICALFDIIMSKKRTILPTAITSSVIKPGHLALGKTNLAMRGACFSSNRLRNKKSVECVKVLKELASMCHRYLGRTTTAENCLARLERIKSYLFGRRHDSASDTQDGSQYQTGLTPSPSEASERNNSSMTPPVSGPSDTQSPIPLPGAPDLPESHQPSLVNKAILDCFQNIWENIVFCRNQLESLLTESLQPDRLQQRQQAVFFFRDLLSTLLPLTSHYEAMVLGLDSDSSDQDVFRQLAAALNSFADFTSMQLHEEVSGQQLWWFSKERTQQEVLRNGLVQLQSFMEGYQELYTGLLPSEQTQVLPVAPTAMLH